MNRVRTVILTLAIAAVGAPVWAAQNDPHKSHHPTFAAAVPGVAPASTSSSTTDKASHDMARMDAQMKVMREMHAKMMAARTPEARDALLTVHMKAMQDGMEMMNAMFPGDMGGLGDMKAIKGMSAGGMDDMKGDMAMHHQMMEKRMGMMQAMMRMMMDRLPAPASK